jgi:fructose-specific phosphotransferase system IIA component
MNLIDLMSEESIQLNLSVANKSEAIIGLVDMMVKARKVPAPNRDAIIQAVRQREEIMTTGIGSGIALPHAKSNLVPELMLGLARSERAIDYDSVDGQPVDLFFLLLSQKDNSGPHIQALARLARLLRDNGFCQALRKAAGPAEALQIVDSHEKIHSLTEF